MEVNSTSNNNTGSTKIPFEEMNLNEHEYSLDVPVSQSDVNRWRTLLHSVEPSTIVLASLHRHLAFHTTPNMSTWTDNNTREMGWATMGSDYGLKSVEQVCAMQQSQEKTSNTQTIHPLAPLPIFNSSAVINLPMTRLLKLRREWLPHRQQFAAYQQRTQLLEAVLKYSVVAVIGIRGSGKTLQIPSIISETEAFKRKRIIVCCANTTSAQLTSLRVRQERGEDVDGAIAAMTSSYISTDKKKKEQSTLTERGGVGVGGGTSSVVGLVLPTYSDATEGSSVIVTVADILLRQLICDPTLSQIGCVIVDDLHLRDEKMEFCLAALRELVLCQEKMISNTTNNTHKETLEKTRLRVILNCVDEHTSSPLLTFFANTRMTSLSLHSSPTTSSSSSLLSSQPFNVPTLYLEETVQWIAKCNSEGSALCRNPDTELASYADRVDVIGKVMASAEADFNQPQMLQSYWCDIILNALTHFTQANMALRASTVLSYKWIPCAVLVIVPNASAMTIIHNTLKQQLELQEHNVNSDMSTTNIDSNNNKNDDNYGTDEVHERSTLKPHYVFTMLHDETTSFDTFWRVAQGKECEYQLNQNNKSNDKTVNTMERTLEVHVLFITPQLAQSALPASLSLGLVIDCARSSWCEWDAHSLVDKEMTEFASLEELRSRRNLTQRHKLSMTGESHTVNTSSSMSNTNSKTIMECVTDGLVMFIQLIPKSILHSAQHRRMSTDPTQHITFHLSLEKYTFMYLYLQLRKHVATLTSSSASSTAVNNGSIANSDTIYNNSTTIPDSIHFFVSSLCVAAPASTSHCYDLLKRNMECAEKYLLNSGLLQQSSSSSSASALALRDEINTMAMHVTPLGLLVNALPLPIHVNRLLVFASVCNCVVPALVMAAVWLVGDPFTESFNSLDEQQHENEKLRRERRALVQEARLFFARDSQSDMVSVFNLIKMWLMVRPDHHDNNDTVDHVKSNGNEEESAFLNECGLSKFHLEETLRMTGELYKLMCRFHLIHAVPQNDNNSTALQDKDALNKFNVNTINQYVTSEIAEAIANNVKGLPEDIAMHGSVQACMTLSLYPHVAIIHQHRLALLLDELHMASVNNKNTNELMPYNDKNAVEEAKESNTIQHSSSSRESWRLIKRFGVFEVSSVMNSTSSATNNDIREMNKQLMMYVGAFRPLTLSFSPSSSSSLMSELEMSSNNNKKTTMVLLSQATPLHLAAAIVSARTVHSHPIRQRSNRCRGWTSLLTFAWRRTSRARLLPPPATQLPQVCIPLQPYDTIHSPQVHLVMDHGLRMTTRESTVQWLRSLQTHIQFHLYTIAMRQTDAEWNEAVESSREIGHAWEWWSRRESNSAAWLREERAIMAAENRKGSTHNEEEEEVEKGKNEISTPKERHLYPYYEFLCVPDLPAKIDAPAFVDHYHYNNNAQEHEQGKGRSEREQQQPLMSEGDDKEGTSQRNVYTGKRPSPDLDEIIKTCVRNIAANHTREAEAQLLRDNKEIFFFLDPDNEFHEYYLFLLRQAAPEMEVLGDNLEELVEVLQQLEVDLRVELGLPAVETQQEIEMHNVTDSSQIQHIQQTKLQNEVEIEGKLQNNLKAEENEEEEELVVETELIDEEYDEYDDADHNEDNNHESKVQLGADNDGRHTYDIEQSGVGVQFENASVNMIRSHGLTDTRHVAGTITTTTTSNAASILPLSIATNTQTQEEQQTGMSNITIAPTSMIPPDQANNSLHPSSSSFIADATMLPTNAINNNTTNAVPSTSGTGQTLMEKLMAMRQGSTTASQTAIIADNNNKNNINTKMQSQVRHFFDPTSVDVIPEEEEEEEIENQKEEISQSENVHIDQTKENNVSSTETRLETTNANTQAATFANNGNVSIEPNFVPPTSAELIALLAVPGLPNTSPTPPPPLPLGENVNSVKVINPLTKPPPPLPSKIIDERAPSVVVYPLPDKKYGNIPLILARALGERLGLRVGPTKIVGNVARIDVPNRKVEARALSLKYFTCVGHKVYLFRNDRIIDNPNPPQRRRKRFMSQRFNSSSTTHGPDQSFSYHNKQNSSLESNSLLPPPPLPPSFVQPPPHPSQHHSSLPHYTVNINANNSTQGQNDFTGKEMGETFRHDELNNQGKEDNLQMNVDNSNAVNEAHLKIGVFSDSDDEDDEDSSVHSDSSTTSIDDNDDDEEEHKDEDVSDNTHNVSTEETNVNKVDKSEQEQIENNNPEMSKLSTSSSEPSPQEQEEEKEYEEGLNAEKQAVAEEENEEIRL